MNVADERYFLRDTNWGDDPAEEPVRDPEFIEWWEDERWDDGYQASLIEQDTYRPA